MLWLGPRLKRTSDGLQTRSGRTRSAAVWRHGERTVDLPGRGTVSYDRLRLRFLEGGAVRKRQWYFNDSEERPTPELKAIVKVDQAMVSIDGGPWLSLLQGPQARETIGELRAAGIEEYLNDGQEEH